MIKKEKKKKKKEKEKPKQTTTTKSRGTASWENLLTERTAPPPKKKKTHTHKKPPPLKANKLGKQIDKRAKNQHAIIKQTNKPAGKQVKQANKQTTNNVNEP